MALITTIPIHRSKVMAAGTSLDSDPIDLREIAEVGSFSLSYNVGTSGGIATCGTTNFSYLGCAYYDGTYVAVTAGTFGTVGNAGGSDIVTISPPLMPFIKIRTSVGSSGTSVVTAQLHVR